MTLNCQDNTPDITKMPIIVRQGATQMSESLMQRDANALIDFHPPRVVKGVGGKQKFIEVLEKYWEEQDKQGMKLIKDSIGDQPSKIIYNKQLYQCTLPQIMTFSKDSKKIVVESTLIGISVDGKKWYFIDAVGNIDDIKRKFPELSDELAIPAQKKPQLLDN